MEFPLLASSSVFLPPGPQTRTRWVVEAGKYVRKQFTQDTPGVPDYKITLQTLLAKGWIGMSALPLINGLGRKVACSYLGVDRSYFQLPPSLSPSTYGLLSQFSDAPVHHLLSRVYCQIWGPDATKQKLAKTDAGSAPADGAPVDPAVKQSYTQQRLVYMALHTLAVSSLIFSAMAAWETVWSGEISFPFTLDNFVKVLIMEVSLKAFCYFLVEQPSDKLGDLREYSPL